MDKNTLKKAKQNVIKMTLIILQCAIEKNNKFGITTS